MSPFSDETTSMPKGFSRLFLRRILINDVEQTIRS